jgi:PAS domain-containing protein
LCDPKGGAAVEVRRGKAWKTVNEWREHHLPVQFSYKEIVPDLGEGGQPCRGVVIPIGVNAEIGLVAAACSRTDFPNEIDQLLLSVAANHAAAAFQNARLRNQLDAKVGELRLAGDELEMKVTQRTGDLRRSEAYLAEAQRLTHTGSWAWNVRTDALFWSQEIFRIYDYDSEMTPTWDFLLERVHPEDRAEIERRKKMESTQKEWADSEIDFRIVLPDGTQTGR